jgi:hypothetical protein
MAVAVLESFSTASALILPALMRIFRSAMESSGGHERV